jgi:NitT/TauT family transport system substrate-binding protein
MLSIHLGRRICGLAVATVTALLLALCANGDGVREAVAQPLPTLHVGTTGKETDAEAFYAADLGLFQRAGLNVDVQVLANGAAIASAIAGGALQVGNTNVLTLAKAHERGLPFSIIALSALYSESSPATVFAVAPNAAITSAKDLAGKVVAGVSLGGLDQLSMEAWIDQNGGDASAEKYVELPPTEMVAALERGTIAAGNVAEPELSAQRSRYRVLGYSYSAVAKRFAQTGWFASKSWIAQNPDLVTKFQAVMAQAAEWASKPANHARASQILAKYAGAAGADARTQFARSLDPALVQPVIDQGLKYKLLDRPVDAADLFAASHEGRGILAAMSSTQSVLPTDQVVHFSHGPGFVAPAAASTYSAPAAHDTYIAPAGRGASELAIHGVGVTVDSHH